MASVLHGWLYVAPPADMRPAVALLFVLLSVVAYGRRKLLQQVTPLRPRAAV